MIISILGEKAFNNTDLWFKTQQIRNRRKLSLIKSIHTRIASGFSIAKFLRYQKRTGISNLTNCHPSVMQNIHFWICNFNYLPLHPFSRMLLEDVVRWSRSIDQNSGRHGVQKTGEPTERRDEKYAQDRWKGVPEKHCPEWSQRWRTPRGRSHGEKLELWA